MLRISIALVVALTMAACSRNGDNAKMADGVGGATMSAAPPMAPPPPPMMEQGAAGAGSMNFAARPGETQIIQPDQIGAGGGGQAGAPRLIAYTYNYGFKVPTAKMQGLLDAHKKLCEDAGTAKCYIVNSSISGIGGDEQSYGQITLRGSADWVKRFRDGMVEGLKPFDATLDSNSDSAEDLTTQIVDSEARLKTMKAWRDKLQEWVTTKTAKLSDLIDLESKLAEVQGNIDAHEAVLAAMKLRVSMSTLTLNYSASYAAGSESIWRPLGDSFEKFVPNFANALAGIVEFIAAVLPWIVIFGAIILVFWLILRGRAKRREKAAKPASPAKSAAST